MSRITGNPEPLHIDVIEIGAGLVGMTLCPGRKEENVFADGWDRDLDADLRSIVDWGAAAIVSLIEAEEFAYFGVTELPSRARDLGLEHFHLPIPDFGVPDVTFERDWEEHGPALHGRLRRGERILIHCLAGLGRTGTIAARLLVERGMNPDAAIALVRHARPGTIQTLAQEFHVRSCGALKGGI
ncbi:MAG: cyclin-dependent kinase inhibitor 3 family protein [Gammaproteobacteria bacterium]